MLRILLYRLFSGRLFPLFVAFELYRLFRDLQEQRRSVRARPVSPIDGSVVVVPRERSAVPTQRRSVN